MFSPLRRSLCCFEISPPYSRQDDRIRCFASLQHDSAMIISYGFVISSERSDERSLFLSVVGNDKNARHPKQLN